MAMFRVLLRLLQPPGTRKMPQGPDGVSPAPPGHPGPRNPIRKIPCLQDSAVRHPQMHLGGPLLFPCLTTICPQMPPSLLSHHPPDNDLRQHVVVATGKNSRQNTNCFPALANLSLTTPLVPRSANISMNNQQQHDQQPHDQQQHDQQRHNQQQHNQSPHPVTSLLRAPNS